MFDLFNPLNFLTYLNPLHWSGLALAGIIALMVTLKSVSNVVSNISDVITPALKATVEGVVWVVKKFFEGVGICFANLSTLTVIVAAIVYGGWQFKTWDNQAIINKYEAQISQLKKEANKCKPATKTSSYRRG